MKYMGSKRAMLQNGLSEVLAREVDGASRFVDLFAGSGSVAIHVAREFPIPVLALDLQKYSVVLTAAVLGRQASLDWPPLWVEWLRRATTKFKARTIPTVNQINTAIVTSVRGWCDEQTDLPITKSYGGHYFSPRQAVWIDALRASLPASEPARTVALAALIQAASQCAAAPGHTAQPFQPTRTAKLFIQEAWNKDIVNKTKAVLELLASQFAQRLGRAEVADANQVAQRLQPGDLAFVDPPYSDVHYSRFYHVLETIAKGNCGEVTGVGRYPALKFRPRSKYSLKTQSAEALDDLLKGIASCGARAIVTFPDHSCSNGLSGNFVREMATRYFRLREHQVASKFSSLGGTGDDRRDEAGRSPRKHAQELILVLKPR
jgi:adenine-specific DNA-methyltransferase